MLSSNLKYYKWIIWLSSDEGSVKRGGGKERMQREITSEVDLLLETCTCRLKVSMSFKKTQIYLMDILG